MKVEKSALELLDQSSIPVDSAILDTVNYEDDNDFQDIDQLSQSLTHSEFLNLLEVDHGAFILEDVTDRLKETYQNEMIPDLTNEKGF